MGSLSSSDIIRGPSSFYFPFCHNPPVACCSKACSLMLQIGAPVPSSLGRHTTWAAEEEPSLVGFLFYHLLSFLLSDIALELPRNFPWYLIGQNFVIPPPLSDHWQRECIYHEWFKLIFTLLSCLPEVQCHLIAKKIGVSKVSGETWL